MILSPPVTLQAAVEYGAATGLAGELSNSLSGVSGSARAAFRTVSSNPMLLAGALLIFVLLYLLLRDPLR